MPILFKIFTIWLLVLFFCNGIAYEMYQSCLYLFDMQVLEDVVLLKKHIHNTKTLQFLQGI